MLVDNMVLERLYQDAGEKRKEKAIDYQKAGKVRIKNVEYENSRNFEISAIVVGTDVYRTYISIKDGIVEDVSCTCEDYYNHYGICKHSLASVIEMQKNNNYIDKYKVKEKEEKAKTRNVLNLGNEYRNFKQIVNSFYQEEIDGIEEGEEGEIPISGDINIEPTIYYDKFANDMKVEFKIGNKRMYKIKNLSEFYTRMMNKELYKYGEKLEFIHTKSAFNEESQELLDFIMKYAEIIKYANSNSNSNYRYYGKALSETSIILGNSGIDDLFDVLKGKEVAFNKDFKEEKVEFTEEEPSLKFELKKKQDGNFIIIPTEEIYEITILKGKKYKYVLENRKLYRCSKEFEKSNLKLLDLFKQNYITELEFGKNELT